MQGKQLFEYAVIRIVPRVEREEFLNVGIILYCKSAQFLKCIYKLDKPRIAAFCPDLECEEVEGNLLSFERICDGIKKENTIGALDMPSRFRWLTATRSTIVQTSKVHPGLCIDPELTLKKLFEQLVN